MDQNIENKIKELKAFFGDACKVKPTVIELRKMFKDNYVSPFKRGIKCYFDLTYLFRNDNSRNWRKLFDNNAWQPITITYKRQDVIFFKWDNYPKYSEEYFLESSDNSVYCRNIYASEIKYSDIFKNKIAKLKNNPNELALQIGVVEINDMHGQIKIIKDV